MKVLVTGSDGYIGMRLVQVLHDRGHQVFGLDTGYYRSGWLYNGSPWLTSVLSKDIRDVTKSDLKGFEAVVHLAEMCNDPIGKIFPKVTYSINRNGTQQLIKACRQAKVRRFVYFSSCSVYGTSPQGSSETSPLNPQTAYSECKLLNEKALLKSVDEHFTPVILRNATAFGASPRMRFDLVVNNLAGIAWTQKEIKMFSDGAPWRAFAHIADISKAAACAIEAPKKAVKGQIFNVGQNSDNYQVKDVAKIVAKVFPGCKITFGNYSDKSDYRVNFDKITSQLPGFSCDYTVRKGVQELKKVFKQIGMDQDIFEARHYTRLKQIQYLRSSKQIDKEFFWTKSS